MMLKEMFNRTARCTTIRPSSSGTSTQNSSSLQQGGIRHGVYFTGIYVIIDEKRSSRTATPAREGLLVKAENQDVVTLTATGARSASTRR